jgi:hypothetical protein
MWELRFGRRGLEDEVGRWRGVEVGKVKVYGGP